MDYLYFYNAEEEGYSFIVLTFANNFAFLFPKIISLFYLNFEIG
jgi:hypothetical protein